uniref:Uncharacterized protein n=1 Tax=viral metagenome TaxID=1070528 RepID=A0A6M3KKY1_9ZZZZ
MDNLVEKVAQILEYHFDDVLWEGGGVEVAQELISLITEEIKKGLEEPCPHGVEHKTTKHRCFKCWQSFFKQYEEEK